MLFKGDWIWWFDNFKENYVIFLFLDDLNDILVLGLYNIRFIIGSGYNGLKESWVWEYYGGLF